MTLSENIAVQKRRIFIKFLKKNIEIIFRSRVQLTLLHVNDVHSHFEEVNINTSTCKYEVKWTIYFKKLLDKRIFNAFYCFCPQKYEEISF